MRELFSIRIKVDDIYEVNGKSKTARMILFSGEVTSELFSGKVLNGAVDTQIQKKGSYNHLSARYILEGKDFKNNSCRIFIENNGNDYGDGRVLETKPSIITDSKELGWLEDADLYGKIESVENVLLIKIMER